MKIGLFQSVSILFILFLAGILWNLNSRVTETLEGLNDAIRTFSAEDITIVFQFPKPFRANDLPER